MNFLQIYVLKREILPSYFFLDKIISIEEDQFIFLPSLFTIYIAPNNELYKRLAQFSSLSSSSCPKTPSKGFFVGFIIQVSSLMYSNANGQPNDQRDMWLLNYYCSDGSCFRKGRGFFFGCGTLASSSGTIKYIWVVNLESANINLRRQFLTNLNGLLLPFLFFFHHQMDYFCLYFHLISFRILILIRSFYYCAGTKPSKMPHVPAKNHLSSFRVSFLIIQ